MTPDTYLNSSSPRTISNICRLLALVGLNIGRLSKDAKSQNLPVLSTDDCDHWSEFEIVSAYV